jgi:hypothetical protein
MRRTFLWAGIYLGLLCGCQGAGEPKPPEAAGAKATTPSADGQDSTGKKLPLRWTDQLALASEEAIPAAMTAKIVPNDELLELSRTEKTAAGKPEKVRVEDCKAYLAAIADAYEPATTFDATQESFFKARCTPLVFLQQSWRAKQSWVNDLRLDEDPLGLLPASMNIAMEEPSDEEKARIARGERLGAYAPGLKVKSKGALGAVLVDPEGQLEVTVDIIAWGDLDHDGIEDVLLFRTFHSLEGSLRGYTHVVLTRKGPGAPLMEIRRLD